MLKADLHLHTSEDPSHRDLRYNAKQLIGHAAKLGFNVLAITNHEKLTYSNALREFARKKGILLIPGAELFIEGSDVLVYNITKKDISRTRTFEDLRKLKKRKKILVIAPHPFYVWRSLGKELLKNAGLFDAVEYSHFYLERMNRPNRRAAHFARMYSKPLVGTSDAHHLWRLNFTYTLVNSEKKISLVISAVKRNRIRLVSKPLSLWIYIKVILWIISGTKKFINKQA